MGYEFIQEELDSRFYRPNYISEYLKDLNLEKFIADFRDSDILMFRITAMNYHLYKSYIDDKNEKDYFTSHKILSDNFELLSDKYKTKIFTIMINYCIRKLNTGNTKFRNELFKLYKQKLSQNLVDDLKNKSYTFNHFRDIVFIGISLKDYDWLENFIEKYSKFLPVEIREDEIRISYAKLDFAKNKYEKSLSNLKKIKASHYLLYIDTSLFKLYNFYELKEFEEAYLEIDKLKHYFRNNKSIPKTLFPHNMNFIKVYKNLIKFQTNPDISDIGYIENDLNKMKLVSNKSWLMKKINELKR